MLVGRKVQYLVIWVFELSVVNNKTCLLQATCQIYAYFTASPLQLHVKHMEHEFLCFLLNCRLHCRSGKSVLKLRLNPHLWLFSRNDPLLEITDWFVSGVISIGLGAISSCGPRGLQRQSMSQRSINMTVTITDWRLGLMCY